MEQMTHIDEDGQAIMVDVTEKSDTERIATAYGSIAVSKAVIQAVTDCTVPKGDVFAAARIAGIMGAKKTSDLIPLCHILCLTKCSVEFAILEDQSRISAVCTVKTVGKTGVEMEALTGVTTALLTIYDMCKALDKSMTINEIYLIKKQGGKSGSYTRETDRPVRTCD